MSLALPRDVGVYLIVHFCAINCFVQCIAATASTLRLCNVLSMKVCKVPLRSNINIVTFYGNLNFVCLVLALRDFP